MSKLSYFLTEAAPAATDPANQTFLQKNQLVTTVLMIAAMIAVFYFLIIRPQKKRDKQARDMRDAIKVGDEIVTIGGVCGKVTNVKEDTITIISSESKMTFLKSAISSVTSPEDK